MFFINRQKWPKFKYSREKEAALPRFKSQMKVSVIRGFHSE